MVKTLYPFILLGVCLAALTGCKLPADKETIHFEVVADTLYVGPGNYRSEFSQWKKRYEECMRTPLFENALYMGLQENVHIGSVSNRYATNINKQFSVFDTSNRKYLMNFFAVVNQANCYNEMNLSKELQNEFYGELVRGLANSGQYQYLTAYIDTSQINFKITSIADIALRPDSLASLLQRTGDSALLRFKQLLVIPGNALLIRTALMYGFYAEFPLKRKLPEKEEAKFKSEVFFKIGNRGESGSIRLLSNQNVQVFINKYYTIFGQICVFKEVK